MPILQAFPPGAAGDNIDLDGARMVLGRHPECDIVLDAAAVSRQHAQILVEGENYFVEDLHSRNGTFVNGRLVEGRRLLVDGDRLKICDLDLYQPHISLQQLHTIKCPTLVIGGDHDAIPVPHTVTIARNIPNSYLWIIPNSGHSTPIFKKDQFNAIISDFFSKPYRKIEGTDTFK